MLPCSTKIFALLFLVAICTDIGVSYKPVDTSKDLVLSSTEKRALDKVPTENNLKLFRTFVRLDSPFLFEFFLLVETSDMG